jgi:serine/threonine protein kinase
MVRRSGSTKFVRSSGSAVWARCISHPAIVSIYAPGQSDDRHYISMELVSGRTLRQVVRDGPVAPRRALHIAAQIADAAPRERFATR